jgi:adenine phosphoribosyltransferase
VGHTEEMKVELEKIVRDSMPIYKDWPKEGVDYLNTVDICRDPVAFRASTDFFFDVAATQDVDHIFAADARGFIWGSVTAYRMGLPLHVIRKKGKMPGELISREYQLEYGTDILEIKKVDVIPNNVIIIDDVLATGGTAIAMCELVHELGIPYKAMTLAALVDITFLNGRQKLKDLGVTVETLINV